MPLYKLQRIACPSSVCKAKHRPHFFPLLFFSPRTNRSSADLAFLLVSSGSLAGERAEPGTKRVRPLQPVTSSCLSRSRRARLPPSAVSPGCTLGDEDVGWGGVFGGRINRAFKQTRHAALSTASRRITRDKAANWT